VDEEALAAFTQRQVLTTGCGGGFSGADSPGGCRRLDTALRVEDRAIRRLMETMTGAAALFRTTGGTHIACLGDSEGRVLFTAEDIGRHNAVDKVVGLALIAGVGVHDLILCSSGRVSSEILSKAARARIPVVVSRSAPTSRAIELAEGFLLTLVGFARGRRMNVYTAPERVVKDPQD
jgi:FdhD protein